MNTMLAAKALLFNSSHDASRPLALANAWDVASALVVEAAGARALATTSAGVAWSLGMPDGDRLDRQRALSVAARIASDVAGTVNGLLEAGAVGTNIEDATCAVDELAARIAVSREMSARAGVPLLIIAASADVFLRGIGAPDQRLPSTLL